jgi:hypothetical protein
MGLQTGGTERMRITTAGNVGIATNTPASQLHVDGANGSGTTLSSNGAGSVAFVSQSFGAAVGMTSRILLGYGQTANADNAFTAIGAEYTAFGGSYAGGALVFGTGTNGRTSIAERMRVTAAGDVGIGTSSPGYKLDVRGGTSSFEGSSGVGAVRIAGAGGSWFWIDNPSTTVLRFSSGASAGTNPMTFTDGGSLGIGTSSPGQTLQVVNASNYQFRLGAGSTFNYDIGRSTSDGFLYFYGNQTSFTGYVFSGADGERMRIDSSGNLLVGKTSTSTSVTGFVALPTGFTATNSNAEAGDMNRQSSDGDLLLFRRAQTQVGSVTVSTTATTYNTSSDYRLKNVDGPITNSGAYIDALKPVQGSWKVDGSRFIGLLAHEVQEVSETQIATGEKDGEKMQAMDYSAPEIIANLIAELQSLRARVAQLEGK